MTLEELHRPLIGQQGSRAALNTPALIVELEALEANIATMARFAAERGVALRPHAKTHKSVEIARRQIAAGAVGVCCAKLGEAEALSAGGIENILITSPVVGPAAVARLAALARRTSGLMAACDHPAAVDALASTGEPLTLVVDIDPGIHRTGVADADAAVALARRIEAAPSLTYAGVQFYCGRQQHIESFAERREAIAERTAYLKGVIEALEKAGLPPRLVTGGGTGSHQIDAELGVLNEFQVGSYVFMDREYGDCDLTGEAAPFRTSLMVDTRVISANHERLATADGGFKTFSTDAGPPTILAGAPDGSKAVFMGDEHMLVVAPEGEAAPGLGQRVTFGAPHCDPTVNLHDLYHVVRGETLVDLWPMQARGRGY